MYSASCAPCSTGERQYPVLSSTGTTPDVTTPLGFPPPSRGPPPPSSSSFPTATASTTPRRPSAGAHTVSSASTTFVSATHPRDLRPGPSKTSHSTPGGGAEAARRPPPDCAFTSRLVHLCTPGPTYRRRSSACFSVVPAAKRRAADSETSSSECLKNPFAPGPVPNAAANRDASLSSCDSVPRTAACAWSPPAPSGTVAWSTVRRKHDMLPPTAVEFTSVPGWTTRSAPFVALTSTRLPPARESSTASFAPRTTRIKSPGETAESAHMSRRVAVRSEAGSEPAEEPPPHDRAVTSKAPSSSRRVLRTRQAESAAPSVSIHASPNSGSARGGSASSDDPSAKPFGGSFERLVRLSRASEEGPGVRVSVGRAPSPFSTGRGPARSGSEPARSAPAASAPERALLWRALSSASAAMAARSNPASSSSPSPQSH